MMNWRGIAFFVFSMTIISCNNRPDAAKSLTPVKDTIVSTRSAIDTNAIKPAITEQAVLDSLSKIFFVKKTNAYIDSLSHHQHGISFLIDTVSNSELKINAGYNGDLRFETYYLFKVNRHTFDIKVMDPLSGDDITIADYEKANK